MTEPPRDRTRHAVLVAVASALGTTLIAIGILGAVTTLFQSRGQLLEELAAAERACSDRVYVSEREQCIREAVHANRVANR